MLLLFCIQITVRRSRRLLEELRSIKLAAKMRELGISLSFSRPVTARKDEAPAAYQAAITIVADLASFSGGGGLIQTTSG